MNREIDLSVSTYGVARSHEYSVVLLPWGATEPHNLHLPYMTDCILSHDIAVDAARVALERYGIRAMVLPPVNMGSQNPGQRELCFCIHTRYETQKAILTDILASLHHQGFRKMLIVNGHGGNTFKNMIRDLAVAYPDFMTATSEWFKLMPVKEFFEMPGDHADEVETSVMMHYHPELVRLEEAGAGDAKAFAIPALRDGQVWPPRAWNKVSADTGIGDPRKATAEKGRRFAEAVAEKYAEFIRDFVRTSPEEMYR
ncbi:MAG TPA: creatininase family protein [Prevotella sp.]